MAGDHAFLAVWSRHVAEATSIGLSREVIAAARSGDEQAFAATLLRQPGNLTYAILYGLFENPEKVTRLLDVFILAVWFRFVGSSVAAAELLMILVSLGSLATVYTLAWVIWRDWRIAIVSALFMALLPGSVETARWVSWHLFGQLTFMLSVLVGLLAIRRYRHDAKYRYLLAAGGVWGLSLYSNSLLPFLVPMALLPAFVSVARRSASVNVDAAKGVPNRPLRITKVVQLGAIYLIGGADLATSHGFCRRALVRIPGPEHHLLCLTLLRRQYHARKTWCDVDRLLRCRDTPDPGLVSVWCVGYRA